MDYKNYNAEDFSSDEHFVNWVKRPDSKSNSFWKKWIGENPEKKNEIDAAKNIVEAIQFKIDTPNDEQVFRMQKNIHQQLNTPQLNALKKKRTFIRIAAAFIILVAAYLVFEFGIDHRDFHQTSFGQTETIDLPDGSEVVLNANSKIYFPNKWEVETEREVWLEGEAFFKVSSAPKIGSAKFVVHAGEVDIAVLGTQFNVKNRAEKVDVVLTEGQVKMSAPQSGSSLLTPGNIASYNIDNQIIKKENINTKVYTSWTNNRLVFDETPLSHLVKIIEESYGKKIEISDPSLLTKQLTGALPNENLDLLLTAVSTVFNLDINQNSEGIISISISQ